MRGFTTMALVLGTFAVTSCSKTSDDGPKQDPAAPQQPAGDGDKAKDPPAGEQPPPAGDPASPAAGEPTAAAPVDVGVEAGGIERAPEEGAAAVVSAASGTVELRRVGEVEFAAAAADAQLYPGDVVRTGEGATATVTLADESVIEIAEVSTVAIAGRHGTADPASGAAVLAGLARFTVTPRAPAEGPFRVFTPTGLIVTRGTTYGVGVAASGVARVGVEEGAVDVYGLAALDAEPVAVDAAFALAFQVDGTLAQPEAWPADDWGTWRDERDAGLDIGAAVDAHAKSLLSLSVDLSASHANLDASAKSFAAFEARAAASADKGDTAAYEAALADGSVSIEAGFALAGRIEALTWAHAGRATLASDLYVRHPTVIEPRWPAVAPQVDASVLWPKRFEVTAAGYLEPLRVQYYVHHPRGRGHAELVGVTVPPHYAKVSPPPLDPVRVRATVKAPIWIAPVPTYRPSKRAIWISAPAPDWRVKVRARPAPPRAKVAWYVRPPAPKAKIYVGSEVRGRHVTRIKVAPPQPRVRLSAGWKVPVGAKVRVGAPDYAAATRARAKVKIDARGRLDVRGRVGVGVAAPPPPPPPRLVVPEPHVGVRAGVRVKAGAGAGVNAGAGARAGARVKVQAPPVRVQAPAVKVKVKAPEVKVKAKAGIRIGR